MVCPCAIQATSVFDTTQRHEKEEVFMCNTAICSVSVLVLSFSCEQAHTAYAYGEGHQFSTENRTNINKRFTDADITQKASAFGYKETLLE
jgi:hypothetical protein